VDDSNKSDVRALIEKLKSVDFIMHRRLLREINVGEKPPHVFLMTKLRQASQSSPEGLRISDLASSFEITASSITQMVTTLEEKGYVRRSMDSEDRRAVRVVLTEEGERLAETISVSVDRVFAGLVDYLGKDKSAELISLLSELTDYFDERKRRHESS